MFISAIKLQSLYYNHKIYVGKRMEQYLPAAEGNKDEDNIVYLCLVVCKTQTTAPDYTGE